ncbi:UNVERIFIED_CONTAM: hypothetical protein RMT77_012471 [Armadillidium vulgare]|nr:Integral membrane protein 2B [Armadillidium vulgare]
MTIVTSTKPKSEKKSLEKPLVVNDVSGSECIEIENGDRDMGRIDMELWLSPSVRRRISTTTTVCVFITALLVMSICIIGGVYLYRQVTQHQRMSRFRGWCGIPFERNALHFSNKDYRLGPNKPFFKDESNAEWMPPTHDRFREEFDIDMDTGLYERIDVPDFGYGRVGQFIHDFKTNKTGIIDPKTKRCFVMPLDREHVKPPKSLYDLLTKMWLGYYNIDSGVIRKTMRVVQPPIEDLNTQGTYIAHNCANFMTFLLVEVKDTDTRVKRSLQANAAGAQAEQPFRVAEFAGKNIVEFTILES